MLYQRVHKDPKNTIADIEAVIAEHPDEYPFHSLLPIANAALSDKKKEYETVVSSYKMFPANMFAFTNYLMSFGDPNNHNNHERPIDGDFYFHKFFP